MTARVIIVNVLSHLIMTFFSFFFPSLVNPAKETLEDGLSRELLEELGVAIPISEEYHVEACFAPPQASCFSSSRLILHFYVKKMEEQQILEVEKAAASTASDHGLEVTRGKKRFSSGLSRTTWTNVHYVFDWCFIQTHNTQAVIHRCSVYFLHVFLSGVLPEQIHIT